MTMACKVGRDTSHLDFDPIVKVEFLKRLQALPTTALVAFLCTKLIDNVCKLLNGVITIQGL
jgi:hypothetical protein